MRIRGHVAAVCAVTLMVAGPVAAPAGAVPPPPVFQWWGVVGWGHNFAGQLGDGTGDTREKPVPTHAPVGAMRQVAAGDVFSLAVDSHGQVWSWGSNLDGGLGDGSTGARPYAAQVPGLTDITQVAAGDGFALALRADGTVWAWGRNTAGQLGDGSTVPHPTPAPVPGLTGVGQISAGGSHALAVAGSTLYAWGSNKLGQLGDGTFVDRPFPAPVPGLTNVTQASAGGNANAVVVDAAWVLTWGANESGQLGDGTYLYSLRPLRLDRLGGRVRQVAAGTRHMVAVRWDGTVIAWGYNGQGQLGDGTFVSRPVPAPAVPVPGYVLEVAAGGATSLSRREDGQVYQWGRRIRTTYPDDVYAVPAQVPTLSAAISIDVGDGVCLAVTNRIPVFEPAGTRPL
jgi:alpha-tubulin suppressor-like RCC1 family protein